MSKYIYIKNIPDFKDTNGNWVRSYSPDRYICHSTRAGVLWDNMLGRCKVGGAFQNRNPTYIGTINGFKDFQEFAEWCQEQYGYLNKDANGQYWQLDKDLIEYGNKVYCKEKCLFIPKNINTLLTNSNAIRGEYPIGVDLHKNSGRLRVRCNDGKSSAVYLGYFLDPISAHQAWQKAKIEVMENILLTDNEVRNHIKLVLIIEQHIQRIKNDLDNGMETK